MNMIFKNEPIKSMRFSDDGQLLGVCDNNYIWIFDILTTKKIKKLPFKNQKLDHIRFSHNNYAILIVSQLNCKWNHIKQIKYIIGQSMKTK